MSSLAKKSMNFMRDVYALANEHANSGRPSNQPPMPAGGLSSQFAAPPNQSYNNYSSSYYRPVSSQGQASFPPPQGIPGPGPYSQQVSVPQQPYGSWSPALTPPTNFPPPPVHHSISDPNVHHGYTSPPQHYHMTSASSISSPVSPESQISTPASGQFQYFPQQKPPLPARQPSQHQPPWNSQSSVNHSPYNSPSSTIPPSVGSFPAPVQFQSPVPHYGYEQFNPNSQPQAVNGFSNVPPPPPPLPQRPNGQVGVAAGSEMGSQAQHHPHGALPALTVSGPPTTGVYHEMPAEPINYHPKPGQSSSTGSAAELHAPSMQHSPALVPEKTTYVAELPGSPVGHSHAKPETSDQSTTSWSALTANPAPSAPPSPLQSVSTHTSEHHTQFSPPGRVSPEYPAKQDVGPFLTSPSPSQQLGQHPAPNASPQAQPISMVQPPQFPSPNQSSLPQHSYPGPPPPGLPYNANHHPPPQQHYQNPTMPLSPPVSQAPVVAPPSTSQPSFDMSSLAAAVNDVSGRQSPWQNPASPAAVVPYQHSGHQQTISAMPDNRTGAGAMMPSQHYQNPQAWNNTWYNQSSMVGPQVTGPMSTMQSYQHNWPAPTNGQIYTLPPTPQMTPQLPTPQTVASYQADHEQKADTLPNTMRVQRDGDQPRVRKILSLDGGGVRGLSSLIILDYVMDMLSNMRGARLEPWQEFDMIAGTSTGGLIAIMLGRLRMSVADCIQAYKHLSREIFTPTHGSANVAGKAIDFLKAKGKFRSEPLEQCIKQILRDHNLSEDELMIDQNPDSPAMFVCAVEGLNSDAVVIRSYKSKEFDDLYGVCKIWEAARATSAASTFFDPINIAGRDYVDGALKRKFFSLRFPFCCAIL